MNHLILIAALLVASPVHAQSALEWAAQGMGQAKDTAVSLSYGSPKKRISARFARRLVRSESMRSGGYSTDYGRVKHVHISLGGREDGARFAHRGGACSNGGGTSQTGGVGGNGWIQIEEYQ